MELLRQWLTGVTCAAIIVALADSLMAGGTVRRIGRLAGGLLLLAAVVKPVLEVDLTVLSAASLRLEAEAVPAAEEAGLDLMKSIIGEETGAYILDKAAELGISCQEVRVTCAVRSKMASQSATSRIRSSSPVPVPIFTSYPKRSSSSTPS